MNCRWSWALPLVLVGAGLIAGCPGPAPTDAGGDAGSDAPACALASDCDDGLYCTGAERCEGGVCVPGTPVVCSDGIDCTVDRCSESRRACQNLGPDEDGDGYGVVGCGDGSDCDDTDPERFPGNPELCDAAGHDEDCDPETLGGVDDDADTFVSAACCNGASCGPDCDDARFTSNPDGAEACNGLDDDCNGMIDEGLLTAGFVDADRDGFGDSSMPLTACVDQVGFAVTGGDCDDTPGTGISRSPGQPEICDSLDNDCDPRIDEMAANVDWFVDEDGDGFGSRSSGLPVSSCIPVADRVLNDRDCDDRNRSVSPRAPETCNAIDDDCNGLADFRIAPGDFEDDDGDRVVDRACMGGRDCDDRSASVGSGDAEICDGRDNDCDMRVDEGASSTVFFRDADGDSFGSSDGAAVVGCAAPMGYVSRGGDCDDGNAGRRPGAAEMCDGVDADCDSTIDEGASAECLDGGVCYAGACRNPMCGPTTDDCDGNGANGCETNVSSSVLHCGACGRPCGAAGTASAPTCAGGACMFSCLPNQGDCDGDPRNGCEVDLRADVAHCGTCSRGCDVRTGDTFACSVGTCGVSCRAGASNCDGDPSNGCETVGTTCPSCGPFSADCDRDGTCDDFGSSALHCGACGRACGPGATCLGGVCDRIVEVDMGTTATCARYSGGRVVCWGEATGAPSGILGPTAPSAPGAPVVIAGFDDAVSLSVGGTTACVVRTTGQVLCWGSNARGLFGTATPASSPTPRIVPVPELASEVVVGRDFACARASLTAFCWGTNWNRVLSAVDPTTTVLSPVAMQFAPMPIDVQRLGVGENGVCAFTGLDIYCVGGLPLLSPSPFGMGQYLFLSPPFTDIVELTVGATVGCIRYRFGQVSCWGDANGTGALGNGLATFTSMDPGTASELGSASDVVTLSGTICAVASNGTLRCVGDNTSRMSGNPANSTPAALTSVPVTGLPAGSVLGRSGNTTHACAVDPAGRVFCWGENDQGECGVPVSPFVLSPTLVGGL